MFFQPHYPKSTSCGGDTSKKPNLFFSKFFILLLVSHFLYSFCFWGIIGRSFLGPCWWPGFVHLPVFLCSGGTHISIIRSNLPPLFPAHISRLVHVLLPPYSAFSQTITILINLQRGKHHALSCRQTRQINPSAGCVKPLTRLPSNKSVIQRWFKEELAKRIPQN